MKHEIWSSNWDDAMVLAEAEVVVVGGGPAGVAAAETAARKGLSVLLIEKQGFLGGQAVGGLSATICGLYMTNENWTIKNGPKQLVFGFAERFRQKLKEKGGLSEAQIYGNTYVEAHEPFAWKCAAEEMLLDADVRILYHTSVCGAKIQDGSLHELMVLTGNGFFRIKAKSFVDSSGDAMLTAAAGGTFRVGKNGAVQNPSLIFKLKNIDEGKFWEYYGENTICHDDFSKRIEAAEKKYQVLMPRKKIWVFHCVNPGEIYVNATSVPGSDGESLNCTDAENITYAEIHGRKQAESYVHFMKEYIPGCEHAYIGEHASSIGVRQTRSVCCQKTLRDDDVENCRKCADGIAKSSWPIELHKGAVPKLFWLMNDYYEIPYGTMVPTGFNNLIVAGRCIDAEHQALASSRVTAQCFSMGQAAGIATALSIKENITFSEIDGRVVRKLLNEDGACLDKEG